MNFQEWIKHNDTSDESVPSDVGVEIDREILPEGHSTSSSDSTIDHGSQDLVGKKRRIALYAGCCGIVVVAIAIIVSVLLASGIFEKNSNAMGGQQDFDFTGVDGSNMPSDVPSFSPTVESSLRPTVTPSPTADPSSSPSSSPSTSPSTTFQPSFTPTIGVPSTSPTWYPTTPFAPVTRPPVVELNLTSETLMTFCVIADVPYDQDEVDALPNQIATQMDGCEFMVHLGDLFTGDTFCDEEDYHIIRDIMLESKVPTFVVVGDNEWNDCQRGMIEIGWERWVTNFLHFENYWSHNFTVARQPGYEENFYFMHKRTLVIGLNVVGGRIHNSTEWSERLQSEFNWTRSIIDLNVPSNADGIIILSHAKPSEDHLELTVPFRNYMANELQNKYPILYLHGDGHDFLYTPHFLQQPNLLRIQHEGGVNEPILKILADPARHPNSVYNAFQFDRQLSLMTV